MNKLVKFESYEFRPHKATHVLKDNNGNLDLLLNRDDILFGHSLMPVLAKTAAEARALAKKINEWADAKEKSESVRFGELLLGDYFMFAKDIDKIPYRVMGRASTDQRGTAERADTGDVLLPRAVAYDTPVVRVHATFVPEEIKP